MRRFTKQQGGFTLLELLIVIVVVGILGFLVIPSLTSGPQKTRDSQRKADLSNIKSALETYYNDNNSYPSAGNPPQPSCTPSANSCLGTVLTAGASPYMKGVPDDPKTGQHYRYAPTPASCGPGACTSYTLTATLENTHDSQAVVGVYTVNSAN